MTERPNFVSNIERPLKDIEEGVAVEGIGFVRVNHFIAWCRHDPLLIEPLKTNPDLLTPRGEEYKNSLAYDESHVNLEYVDRKNFDLHVQILQIPRDKIEFCPNHGIIEARISPILTFPDFSLVGVGTVFYDWYGSNTSYKGYSLYIIGWQNLDRPPNNGDIYQVILPYEYSSVPRIVFEDRQVDYGDVYELRQELYDKPIDYNVNCLRQTALLAMKEGY